jgi:ABC-type transport system involved in Fe-S cluster assembly fused permease/ATPase subunit
MDARQAFARHVAEEFGIRRAPERIDVTAGTIVRAILRDEATSALDAESEGLMQAALTA